MHRPSMRSTWRTGTASEVLGLVGTSQREREGHSGGHGTAVATAPRTNAYARTWAATERLKCVRNALCAVR